VIVLAAVVVVLAVRAAAPFLARPVRRRRWGEGCWSGSVGLWG
jgi:hypothetical protein